MLPRAIWWVAATEQDGVSPTLAAISAARGFVNLELGHFARTHTLLRFHLNSSPSVSPARWKKLGQFFKQIHVGWKCKLMIWSFNHSGANPDAEEFPADSGSSDFTNPRQPLLEPLLLLLLLLLSFPCNADADAAGPLCACVSGMAEICSIYMNGS